MPSITIRDVAVEVRNELSARAAGRGQSMQEFPRAELIGIVEKPSVDEILAARDADRT